MKIPQGRLSLKTKTIRESVQVGKGKSNEDGKTDIGASNKVEHEGADCAQGWRHCAFPAHVNKTHYALNTKVNAHIR